MNTTTYGPVTDRLLSATEDIWASYHKHPFVQGIADGSLDHEKFRYYMIQDYLYLIDYARVFAIGVAKAQDMETMRLFASYVGQIMDGEMDIHRGYMKRLGISLEEAEHTHVALDNLSYTSYMIRVAYDEGPAEIAAAILSCALSYEIIARQIVAEHPDADHHPFYGEWVEGYANEGYHQANLELIALTERLAADYNERQLSHLTEIFAACSRYEGLFWDLAWEMRR
jgi:thiaminase/transcriptional activator TenA